MLNSTNKMGASWNIASELNNKNKTSFLYTFRKVKNAIREQKYMKRKVLANLFNCQTEPIGI